jgi:hypothetical protein
MEISEFDKKTIKRMKELNIKTREFGLEHGGLLCRDSITKKIILENECVGTTCSIKHHGECKTNREGLFHTHPSKNDNLSYSDLIGLLNPKNNISCIGTLKHDNNNIKCFSKKDTNKIMNIDLLKKDEIIYKKLLNERKEVSEYIDSLENESDINIEDEDELEYIDIEIKKLRNSKNNIIKEHLNSFII